MTDPKIEALEEKADHLEREVAKTDPEASEDRLLGEHHFKEPEKQGPGVV